jgi:transposase
MTKDPADPSQPPGPALGRLDDALWDVIKGCFPEARRPWRRRERQGGRPRLPARLAFEALLWHLAAAKPWSRLPARFGSSRTVHRRLDLWLKQGNLRAAWRRYLESAPDRTRRAWRAALVARPGKKRGFWYWELSGAAQALGRG